MNINHVSDQELIDMYLSDNHAAIEVLINRYKEKVLTYIYFQVKDMPLAEDLFQDTFIKVINSIRAECYRDEGRFLAWVYRIAHNIICDYWRKEKRTPEIDNDLEFDIFDTIKIYDNSFEEKIITDQIHDDVKKLLDYLPEEQKQVVMMRHFSGMTFSDIAEETNTSINTVLGRMRYALNNLRRLIKEKELVLTY